jgi:hypothetical protein
LKVLKIVFIVLSSLGFLSSAYATVERPGAERYENVTEKFGLAKADRIVIQMYFPQNYFSRIHKAFQYSSEITDKDDLAKILIGFSSIGTCTNYDNRYESLGTWTFYSGGREIFNISLSFHNYDPIFLVHDNCYLSYETQILPKAQFINTVLKYMPPDVRKARKSKLPH